MDLPESTREAIGPAEEDLVGGLAEEPFDPTDDAYAQAELQRRSERMERMIEKAAKSD